MKMKKQSTILISLLITASLLAGCGKAEEYDDYSVELVEPVGVTESFYKVSRRDIISYKVVSGKVVPRTYEYAFSSTQQFKGYGALPGEEVKAGDALAYASTEKIDEEIEKQEEKISEALKQYNDYYSEARESLSKAESEEKYASEIVERYEENDIPHDKWFDVFQSQKVNSTASREKLEQEMKKKSELFELDSNYDKLCLDRLKDKRDDVVVSSGISGTVVAICTAGEDQYLGKENPVSAVGDFNALEVKTDTVYESEVKRAEEIYAIVNGERFNVTYRPLTNEEVEKFSSQVTNYSTFILDDPEKKVKVGDFATIVLIEKRESDVLCVPTESISNDGSESFVYRFDGTDSIYTPVKTGTKSGYYTEIVSGLDEGDEIVSEMKLKSTNKTAKVEKGKVCSEFSGNGYLFYTQTEWIENPVENGTVYIEEIKVKRNERVEKGQIIATIRVVPDDIAIRRLERTILRANEDLAELEKDNSEDKNKKAIEAKKEYIEDLSEKYNDMTSDSTLKEIQAPYAGIMTAVNEFEEGDILLKDGKIAQISAEENNFIITEDEIGQLTYGNKVTVEYQDEENNKCITEGEVVSVAPCALSEGISIGYALIKVPAEDMAIMAAANNGRDGRWMRSVFSVKAETRFVEDVLIVPRMAVTLNGGVTYVKVKNADGKIDYASFVAGGSDNKNYWVAEGLSEGTEICLE